MISSSKAHYHARGEGMELKELNYLIAVYEEHSISRAAERLYMAQSSLSQFLTTFETNLGYKLFIRTSTGVRPTEAGKVMIDFAYHTLSEFHRVQDEMQDIAKLQKGSVIFGISGFRGSYLTPPILKRFRELYPDIHINIVEQNSMALEEMLLSGEIDIALIVLPASDKRIDPEFLIRDEICLITGRSHPVLKYAQEKQHSDSDIWLSIDIRDTAPFEYYLSDYDTILGREARRIFARNDLIPKAYNEKMTALFAAAMAAEGQGLAFTYYSSRHYFSNAEFISIKNENPFIELAVALSPGRYHSNAALALKDVIFEVFGDQNARPKASSKASRSK